MQGGLAYLESLGYRLWFNMQNYMLFLVILKTATQSNGNSHFPSAELLLRAFGFQPLGCKSYDTTGANCFLPFPMSKVSLPNQ